MLTRKKSLATYCRDKRLREGKPLFTPRQILTSTPQSATLSRKGSQDRREAGKRTRATLKRQSAKAKALVTPRKACCAAVRLRSGGRCEVRIAAICTGWHDHTHEIKARSAGGSITDPENCLAVCFVCHRWLDEHANTARELGFISPRGA